MTRLQKGQQYFQVEEITPKNRSFLMPCPLNCRTMMTKWEIFHLLLGKTRFLQ